jgi:hypothetical protein
MPDAPAASYVKIENIRASHHRFTGSIRPSLRNGFNGFLRALPGEPGLLSPSRRDAKHHRQLTPASGRQDHTTSPSASYALSSSRSWRPPHPALHVRDDRDTPLLMRGGTAGISNAASSKRRSEIFFAKGLDIGETRRALICPSGKSLFSARRAG